MTRRSDHSLSLCTSRQWTGLTKRELLDEEMMKLTYVKYMENAFELEKQGCADDYRVKSQSLRALCCTAARLP